MRSRYEILLQNYCKLIHIEARTMVDMANKEILPAVSEYSQTLGSTILTKQSVCANLNCQYETETLTEISRLQAKAYESVKKLEKALVSALKIDDATKQAVYYKTKILSTMQALRDSVDRLETIVSCDYWPFPTYGDLLFGV